MKRRKNVLPKQHNKNTNTLLQQQKIHISLAKPTPKRRRAKAHGLRTSNAPIIRRYYQPIPQVTDAQTYKTLDSIGNTLRELKREQQVLRDATAPKVYTTIPRYNSDSEAAVTNPLKRTKIEPP